MEKAFAREGDKMKSRRLFNQRKQGMNESIDQYLFDCLRLARRADLEMKEKKKIDTNIDGLLRPYFDQTYTKTFASVEALKTHLRGLEDASHTFRTDHFENTGVSQINEEVREMKEMLKKMSVRPARPQFNNVEVNQQEKKVTFSSKVTRSSDGKPVCFNCRGVGHVSARCPSYKAYCFYCGQAGHNQRNCIRRQRDFSANSGNLRRRN